MTRGEHYRTWHTMHNNEAPHDMSRAGSTGISVAGEPLRREMFDVKGAMERRMVPCRWSPHPILLEQI